MAQARLSASHSFPLGFLKMGCPSSEPQPPYPITLHALDYFRPLFPRFYGQCLELCVTCFRVTTVLPVAIRGLRSCAPASVTVRDRMTLARIFRRNILRLALWLRFSLLARIVRSYSARIAKLELEFVFASAHQAACAPHGACLVSRAC